MNTTAEGGPVAAVARDRRSAGREIAALFVPAIQPNSGIAASVAKKVPVNNHCRFSTPPTMPIVSRTGRSMK